MIEVKVLIKGYFSESIGGRTCSTVTLIRDGENNIIVDPGTLSTQKLLINKLKKEGLEPKDIDFVFITHSHLDHYRNIGMFPKAKSLDFFGCWQGDVCQKYAKNFSKNIQIIPTSGHSKDSITFLVKTKKGKIAICGDVFWKKDHPQNDPYAHDKKKLAISRKRVLKMADYLIPGHDKISKIDHCYTS